MPQVTLARRTDNFELESKKEIDSMKNKMIERKVERETERERERDR